MGKSLGVFVHTAGPNTALVKSSGRKDVRIIIGGRMFALPILQRVDRLSLELRTITVHTTHGLTSTGVAVDITSACQVKIHGWNSGDDASAFRVENNNSASIGGGLRIDHAAIRLAAQHFLGKNEKQVEEAIQKTIAGHQRAIIGSLTVEELYRDREAFCKKVLDLISLDMRNMGLVVVSYTVAEISDSNGYIDALGVTRTEKVKREAMEGSAEHRAAAKSRSAREDAAAHLEVNAQIQRKIESDKQMKIIDAKAKEVVERQVAVQQKANAISSAEQDERLFVATQKARAAETKAELEVLKQQVEKEKLMKEKMVHVEADALLYKAQVNADSVRASAAAEAERIRMLGEAQAEATRLKGLAEVEVIKQRIKAWEGADNNGALLEKVIEALPDVARAIAAPLSKTEKMVFVSGGQGQGGGPAAFTKDFNRIISEMPEVVKAITGLDLSKTLSNMGNSNVANGVIQGAAEGASTALMENVIQSR